MAVTAQDIDATMLLYAPGLSTIDETRRIDFITNAMAQFTESLFVGVYQDMLAYYCAHFLSLGQQSGGGVIPATGSLRSLTQGDLKKEWFSAGLLKGTDAVFESTVYGRMFVYLRNQRRYGPVNKMSLRITP